MATFYDISEVKKQSTQIKDKEGLLASINFVKEFIESNNIEFKDLISLLIKVIPYMKKEKTLKDEEILQYIQSQIDRFEDKNKVENITIIADTLSRVNYRNGLEYLEKKLGSFETDGEKSPMYFDALIQLSDFYLTDKQSDLAFRTIQRAILLLTNSTEKFDYLLKQSIAAVKSANICLNGQKTPQYSDYVHYELVAFILEISRDLISFPHLSGFFHRKNTCFTKVWIFEENDNFNNALENLKITKYKKELINEIYNFTFNELPIKIGIPEEYLNENESDSLLSPSNNPQWRNVMKISMELNNNPFNEIGDIHKFASNVVKKYYDLEN